MSSLRKSLFSLASLSALILLGVGAQANTLNVPSQYVTIQAAINGANADDTIQIAAGTYYENLLWNNKDLILQGTGAGSTILNANGSGYCLQTSGLSSASRLQGVTLTGGSSIRHWSDIIYDWVFDAPGGGMTNTGSNLTIANCAFSNNAALYGYNDDEGDNYIRGIGAGLCNFGSNPTVTNCTFSGNSVFAGGGMFNDFSSSPTVTNCTFSGNTVSGGGGGMFNYMSSPTVTNCILWGNSATRSGGIYDFYGGSLTMTYSDDQDLSNTTPDANSNFAADPLFARNPGTNGANDIGDLHLQAASLASMSVTTPSSPRPPS